MLNTHLRGFLNSPKDFRELTKETEQVRIVLRGAEGVVIDGMVVHCSWGHDIDGQIMHVGKLVPRDRELTNVSEIMLAVLKRTESIGLSGKSVRGSRSHDRAGETTHVGTIGSREQHLVFDSGGAKSAWHTYFVSSEGLGYSSRIDHALWDRVCSLSNCKSLKLLATHLGEDVDERNGDDGQQYCVFDPGGTPRSNGWVEMLEVKHQEDKTTLKFGHHVEASNPLNMGTVNTSNDQDLRSNLFEERGNDVPKNRTHRVHHNMVDRGGGKHTWSTYNTCWPEEQERSMMGRSKENEGMQGARWAEVHKHARDTSARRAGPSARGEQAMDLGFGERIDLEIGQVHTKAPRTHEAVCARSRLISRAGRLWSS